MQVRIDIKWRMHSNISAEPQAHSKCSFMLKKYQNVINNNIPAPQREGLNTFDSNTATILAQSLNSKGINVNHYNRLKDLCFVHLGDISCGVILPHKQAYKNGPIS